MIVNNLGASSKYDKNVETTLIVASATAAVIVICILVRAIMRQSRTQGYVNLERQSFIA